MKLTRVARRLLSVGAICMATTGLATVPPAAAENFVPGSAGLGDPFFPKGVDS